MSEKKITPAQCTEFHEALARIKKLQAEFEHARTESIATGKFKDAKKAAQTLDRELKKLESHFETFESLHLREQYDQQRNMWDAIGVLHEMERFNNLPLPPLETILEKFKQKTKIVNQKEKQGFRKLLLVPVGLSILELTNAYEKMLYLCLDNGPVFIHGLDYSINSEIKTTKIFIGGAIKPDNLIYYPNSFAFSEERHKGMTKKQLIRQTKGWDILLVEDVPNILENSKNNSPIGGRNPIHTGKSANEYIAQHHPRNPNSPYAHEVGLTLETWLTRAIDRLSRASELSDVNDGIHGAPVTLTGNWIPSNAQVPYAYFSPHSGKTLLDSVTLNERNPKWGTITAVRI